MLDFIDILVGGIALLIFGWFAFESTLMVEDQRRWRRRQEEAEKKLEKNEKK